MSNSRGAVLQQRVDPLPEGRELLGAEQLGQPPGQLLVVAQLLQLGALGRLELAVGEAPEQRTQFVLGGERQAMVDAEHGAVGARQQVAALAVGVVDHGGEQRYPAQRRAVVVCQDPVGAVGELHGQHRAPLLGVLGTQILENGHGAGQVGVLDPLLDHAAAERAVAIHRARHDAPAGRLAHRVGRELARREGAVREVVQRPLPRDRLVDAGHAGAVQLDAAVERRVGGLGEPALDGELSLAEHALDVHGRAHAARRR